MTAVARLEPSSRARRARLQTKKLALGTESSLQAYFAANATER
jgi:hypothetical protein